MRVNKVKQALKEGKLQLGCSVSMIRSPEITRILAAAGLDWTYLDSEHGGFDLETLQDMARAANDNGLCPIIRVAELQYALVARALDCGAQGVLFPRVESPEVLAQAISWTKFPPLGVRGFGLQPTHLNYEMRTMPEIIAHMNEHVMVVLQIETVTAMNRVDELLSVPGVDAVMIGPADLSISLGVPGQFEHPTMIAAIEKIRDACLRHGVAPGIHVRFAKLAKYWRDNGLTFVSCNSEIGYLLEKAQETVAALRG
jgi:2-dehydro-3-deoxyglucarate aldolase/4-hydroxy-2-oxoheptanedioate aldolase